MNTPALTSSVQVRANTPGEAAGNSVAARSAAASNSPDVWAFGSSDIRYENGVPRPATQDELDAETGSSPAAMLKVLGVGADLLRFNANGYYQDDVDHIVALQSQLDKTPKEIAEEVNAATVALRNKMREDIKNGVFTVDDAGNVYFDDKEEGSAPIPITRENVGFEMNALLIESITLKVTELNQLNDHMVALHRWQKENPEHVYFSHYAYDPGSSNNPNDYIKITDITRETIYVHYEPNLQRFRDRLGSVISAAGLDGDDDAAFVNNLYKQYEELIGGDNPVDENPVGENPVDENPVDENPVDENPVDENPVDENPADENPVDENPVGENPVDENPVDENPVGDNPVDENPVGDNPGIYKWVIPQSAPNKLIFDHYRYRPEGKAIYRMEPGKIDTVAIESARVQVKTKAQTLSTLSEQIATDFKVDNARFNSIIEAMNNYNKTVMDTLRRFSII